jgi:hypothetical protein
MSKFVAIIILCLYSSYSWSDTTMRNSGESNENLVNRLIPGGASITHGVIKTTEWHFQSPALIAFYEHEDNVVGLILVPTSKNKYEILEIDTYGPEGANAEIKSIFFAKSEMKEEKKMFVIVSWSNNSGTLYATYAYDRPQPNSGAEKLVPLVKLSSIFGMECNYCPYSGNPEEPAKYKTAADVKAELKRRMK